MKDDRCEGAQILSPSLFNLVTQSTLLMSINDINDVYLAVSRGVAMMTGFESVDQMIGTTNQDLKCESVVLADKFKRQIQEVFFQKKNSKHFNIGKYSDSKFHVLVGERTPIFDDHNISEVQSVLTVAFELQDNFLINCFKKLVVEDEYFNGEGEFFEYTSGVVGSPHDITPREHECLFLHARGRSAKEISNILSISKRTVESHIDNLKNKLGCHKKSQLIDFAFQNGYISMLPERFLQVFSTFAV